MISHNILVTFTFLRNSLIYSQPRALFKKHWSSPFHDRGQHVITCTITTSHFRLYIPEPRRWRNRFVRLPRERRLGVRIPEATDPSRKNRLWQLHCQTLGDVQVIGDEHLKRMSRVTVVVDLHCSMTIIAEQMSKFAVIYWKWWLLHMKEKFSRGMKKKINTNKQKWCA